MRGAFLVIIALLELHNFLSSPHIRDSFMTARHTFLSRCRYVQLALGVFGFFGFHYFGHARAATINANSASFAHVSGAVAQASDGDTVVIPAGTATYTSTLRITKAITLQGAGAGNTIIKDDVPRVGTSAVMLWTLKANLPSRLTGIELQNAASAASFTGAILVSGSEVDNRTMRIDHCAFTNLGAPAIQIEGALGVADHNTFTYNRGEGILVFHRGWGGTNYGDGSWADLPYFGTSKFFFFEDNTFTNTTVYQTVGNIDSWAGGRYVARHNTFNNTLANTHGTESGSRQRSVRAIEVYNNTFNFTFAAGAGQIRGGTAVIHDNTYGASVLYGMLLTSYRQYLPFPPWGSANGNNAWDSNDTHGIYASGTHTAAQSNTVLTDSGATWTTNQWVGYSVTNTVTGRASWIKSNTATTITYFFDNSYDSNGNLVFHTGDGYAIYKLLIALEQPGRGKGDLVRGDTPINSTTGTAAWTHEALEPIYSWNNNRPISSEEPTIQENRDFYNNTAMPGYTPYTYPHPLVHGPDSPHGLRVVQ
jgi:hypothetical protein